MKNSPNIMIGVSIIALITIFAIIVTCVVYKANGVSCALNESIDIDTDITISFFTIITTILVPAIALISALLYYGALIEQRRQNENLSLQHFEAQYNDLVRHQCLIRDQMSIELPILLNNSKSSKIFHGQGIFVRLNEIHNDLTKAIESKGDYSDKDLLDSACECESQKLNEDQVLEHEDNKEYQHQVNLLNHTRRVCFIANHFNLSGSIDPKYAEQEAFKLIYKRYFQLSALYFTHLCSIMMFLDRNFNIYGLTISQQNEYIQRLKDNLSAAEMNIIKHYTSYNLSQKSIINKILFAPSY